ncbi:MAG TPA: hypothetical protein VGE52_14715, partial [Pirellulales bacterium]
QGDPLDADASNPPASPAAPASAAPSPTANAPPLPIAPAERAKLPESLRRLMHGVEELLRSGLTAATDALRQTLDVAFRDAARIRLIRLSNSLRVVMEELTRFTEGKPEFSKKRMMFFLARSWIFSRMLAQALESGDDASAARLLLAAPARPLASLPLATIGVVKRVARGVNVLFEFRLRTTQEIEGLPVGSDVLWSCVYPAPNANVPPEAYLRLEQKQKFKPWQLLEGREIVVRQAALSVDGFGVRRLVLHDQSTLEFGEPVGDWKSLYHWDSAASLQKLAAHRPTPLDIPTELATEIVLPDWKFEAPRPQLRDGRQVWPGSAPGLDFQAEISSGPDGDALRKSLAEQAARSPRLPLFGVMHYEMGEGIFQPLSVLGNDGPIHLNISNETVNMKELLKTIKF